MCGVRRILSGTNYLFQKFKPQTSKNSQRQQVIILMDHKLIDTNSDTRVIEEILLAL